MKAKWLIGVAVVAAIAAFAWRESVVPSADEGKAASADAASASTAAGSGSGVAARAAALPRFEARGIARSAPARLTLGSELASAKSYKALYDRLANSAEGQTADGQYVLYRILRACANVTDRKYRGPRTGTDLQQQRDFVTALPDTDPNKARRVAALEQLGEDHCVGLSGIVTTEAELSKRLGDAVAAGSPGARAFQVEQDMWQERRGQGRVGPTLSENQIDSLRTAINSKDPEAMLTAGRVLSNTFRDVTVRVGTDQAAVEGRALVNAFTLMACEYGYPCGDNNLRVLNACAYQGHCAAGNLPDYLNYYVSSPNDTMLSDQYRNILRTAIATGDWSAITFARGPTAAGPQTFFQGPPGR